MVVVAGPSGSGKSTHFPVAELGIAHFNVDDRCAELNGGSYQAIPPQVRQRVQQECESFVERCTMEGRSFAVETTLRTDVAVRQAEAAKAAGFRLEMIFIATDAADENVLRVARRGRDGGHSAVAVGTTLRPSTRVAPRTDPSG
ncbi:MAG TPA: zeta toxin family protein, partial [Kofleriaceae bacterium]|nr:zeta toxin family protein [Kofleriaceae bacterium]